MTDAWRAGYDLLADRVARLPDLLRTSAAIEWPDVACGPVRRWVTTGVGSSAAHARFLAHLLAEHLGLDARHVPLSAFLGAPPPGAADDGLVVVSQGLSPNARLALAQRRQWRQVVVMTAADDETRRPILSELRADGVPVLRFAGAEEFGTLLRVVGPMAGYLAAVRFAERLGFASAAGLDDVLAALARVVPPAVTLDERLAFLASGTYVELTQNLQYKVLEGMLLPLPPVWDLLHVAHGPFQQAFPHRATFIALARADAPGEEALLDRFAGMLDPSRHRLVRTTATLPGPLAILEHEAALNALLLRGLEERGIDQIRWPGRGREAPLYDLDRSPATPRLGDLTWREVEDLRPQERTAVVALGSTEQHGPHLPCATDTWVAEALAERFCARVPEAVLAAVVPIGCSREHHEFPGTLDLRPETLEAVVADVLRSLARQGFARAFVFSGHGGNAAPLADALPRLRAACAPVDVVAFTDLDGLTAALHAASAGFGVSTEASGHHAGELETSIMLALRPAAVRTNTLAAGHTTPTADPQALFYPSLRPNAPSGTVGDPRAASGERGERYLAMWVDVLEATYRREKKSRSANGTQNA
jgi:creatinine amidohydrolase